MKFKLRQWHVYALLWFWVLLYPVGHALLNNSTTFRLQDLWQVWANFIPFIVLFIIHNRFIIPRFPLPHRITSYLITTLTLLMAFVLIQYISFEENERSDKARKPQPEMQRPHDRPFGEPEPFGQRPLHEERKPLPEPPEHDKIPGYLMDGVIAILMLGCNQAIVLLFKMQKEQEKAEQAEKERLENELKYLKAQLNPHFLMNMLNNIHTMIEVNPEKAEEMVINFSKLMRYVLYDGGKQLVPLSSEAAFIANYVLLMEQRCSSKKVQISLSLPECISDKIMIPPLLSIVFIENAFKHGISYRKPSFIHVDLSVTTNNQVCLKCENSIPEHNEENHITQGGIGLKNVRKRLDLLFGANYTLNIQTTADIYKVTLIIPTFYDEKH